METPEYPLLATQARMEGDVVVQVLADVRGHPRQWEIVSGPGVFHAEVNRVLPLWRFHPLRQGNQPVEGIYRLVIRFTLRQG